MREGEVGVAEAWRRGAKLIGNGVVNYEGIRGGRGKGVSIQSAGVENTFHIQVHYFCKRAVWMGVKGLAPCCPRIGE